MALAGPRAHSWSCRYVLAFDAQSAPTHCLLCGSATTSGDRCSRRRRIGATTTLMSTFDPSRRTRCECFQCDVHPDVLLRTIALSRRASCARRSVPAPQTPSHARYPCAFRTATTARLCTSAHAAVFNNSANLLRFRSTATDAGRTVAGGRLRKRRQGKDKRLQDRRIPADFSKAARLLVRSIAQPALRETSR